MLKKHRGPNAIYLTWGMPFPNNLQPTAGAPALSFDQYCAQLADAGANTFRLKLCGWNGPLGTGALSFEPRLGQYDPWDGRLQELVAACWDHGVKLHVIPFDNVELRSGWAKHAWNTNNGGFLSDPRLVFTAARAIQAAKDRIDAIVARCGDVIGAWEICAEMSFIATPDFWETNGWNAAMRANVREKMVPWVSAMAQHIEGNHSAPVGNGQVFAGNKKFSDDPDHPSRVRNEIFMVPPLDFAMINWYGNTSNLPAKLRWLRECQRVIGKPIYVEQYAPWELGRNAPYTREPPNFSWSKAHEWAAVCGERGLTGPMRWPEIRPSGNVGQWWGVAHPNLAEIAGVSAKMASTVNLSEWGDGEPWDNEIASPGLEVASSWGDGRHVVAFMQWGTGGRKALDVSGLADGEYAVTVWNFITGTLQDAIAATSTGRMLLNIPTTEQSAVLYIEPGDAPPPVEKRTLDVVATLKVDGQPEGVFTGTLTEVEL